MIKLFQKLCKRLDDFRFDDNIAITRNKPRLGLYLILVVSAVFLVCYAN